jgi:hypothetical protein
VPHETVCYIQPRDAVVNMERPKSFLPDTRALLDNAAPSHDTFRSLPKALTQKGSSFNWQPGVGRIHIAENDSPRKARPAVDALLFRSF